MKFVMQIDRGDYLADLVRIQNLLLIGGRHPLSVNGSIKLLSGGTQSIELPSFMMSLNSSSNCNAPGYPKRYLVNVSTFGHASKDEVIEQIEEIERWYSSDGVSIISYEFELSDDFSFEKSNILRRADELTLFKKADKEQSCFYEQLLNKMQPHFNDSNKAVQESLHNKKYNQAIRRISTACENNKAALSILLILLKHKKALNIDINETAGEKGRSAIHYAAIKQNKIIFKTLIEHGANPSIKDGDGQSVLSYYDTLVAQGFIVLPDEAGSSYGSSESFGNSISEESPRLKNIFQ